MDLYHQHWKCMYVAAVASFSSPRGGQSIGRHVLVVSFFEGAKGLHSPRPPAVLPWSLEMVFIALSQPPFEPVTSIDLKELLLKNALILALALAKRIGDLHTFSVDSSCIPSLSGRHRATCLNHYLSPSEHRLSLSAMSSGSLPSRHD